MYVIINEIQKQIKGQKHNSLTINKSLNKQQQMQQPLSYQTYNNNNYTYQNTNQQYHQNNIEKTSNIPFNYNTINRNNYHYNYSNNNINNHHISNNLSNNNMSNNNINNNNINNNNINNNNINNNNMNNNNMNNNQNNKINTQQNFYKPQPQHQYRPQSQKQKKQYNNYTQISRPISNQVDPNKSIKFIPQLFPNTFKLLDLNKFVNQNVKLRNKLLLQLQTIKQKNITLKNKTIKQEEEKQKTSTRDTTPKRHIRDKSSNLYNNQRNKKTQYIPRFGQNIDQNQQLAQLMQMKRQKQQQIQQQKQKLSQLQSGNQNKRQQIQKLQTQALHQSIHQTPLLRQKQQAIEYLSIQVEWLNDKNLQLRRLVNNKSAQDNVFEMYEKMCRQVQSLRKQNNKKSQKLKKLFEKTNKITGKQENVNMFLMNLKV